MSGAERRVSRGGRELYCASLPEGPASLPEDCASCGRPAAHSHRERFGDCVLLVPYCEPCSQSYAAAVTRGWAACIAGVVLAVTSVLAVPRAMPQLGLWGFGALTLALSLAPAAILWSFSVSVQAPRTTSSSAAWLFSTSQLVGTRLEWFLRFAEINGQQPPSRFIGRVPRVPLKAYVGALVGLCSIFPIYALQRPPLVVLNLVGVDGVLEVDGVPHGELESSSLESAHAGIHIRLWSGERRLVLKAKDGAELAALTVLLRSGRDHLAVLGEHDQCFWLERQTYGRAPASSRQIQRLQGRGFWVLSDPIDTWFAPNPDPSDDRRSTGGHMLALRQALCDRAP